MIEPDWDAYDQTTPLTAVGVLSWAIYETLRIRVKTTDFPMERTIESLMCVPENYRW